MFVHVHTEHIKTVNVGIGLVITVMAEASTDILVDEDGTHVSKLLCENL